VSICVGPGALSHLYFSQCQPSLYVHFALGISSTILSKLGLRKRNPHDILARQVPELSLEITSRRIAHFISDFLGSFGLGSDNRQC
jgi:hypothetical protein